MKAKTAGVVGVAWCLVWILALVLLVGELCGGRGEELPPAYDAGQLQQLRSRVSKLEGRVDALIEWNMQQRTKEMEL